MDKHTKIISDPDPCANPLDKDNEIEILKKKVDMLRRKIAGDDGPFYEGGETTPIQGIKRVIRSV